MKPVDAHCHIDFEQYDEDREQVIERSKEKMEFIVNAGSNFKHNEQALRLQEQHPDFIIANLGLHPTFLDDFDQLDEIKQQIIENDPAAIGEIGMDFYHVKEDEDRAKQEKIFREFLDLAEELHKPIVVHTRSAERQCVDIINEYDMPGVMLHCFNGKPELAREAVENGMKIGVTTQVLYSKRVKAIVEELDLENVLLETDSPFLYRGERNEPLNVVESAEKIAEIKGCSVEEVIEKTTLNASNLFRN